MIFLMDNSGGDMLALQLAAILRRMRIGSMSMRGDGFTVSLRSFLLDGKLVFLEGRGVYIFISFS